MSFKIGDRVRVTRKAESYENGWRNSWNEADMDRCVGKVFSILRNNEKFGYVLETRFITDSDYSFPEFVLKPEIKVGEQLEFDFMYND